MVGSSRGCIISACLRNTLPRHALHRTRSNAARRPLTITPVINLDTAKGTRYRNGEISVRGLLVTTWLYINVNARIFKWTNHDRPIKPKNATVTVTVTNSDYHIHAESTVNAMEIDPIPYNKHNTNRDWLTWTWFEQWLSADARPTVPSSLVLGFPRQWSLLHQRLYDEGWAWQSQHTARPEGDVGTNLYMHCTCMLVYTRQLLYCMWQEYIHTYIQYVHVHYCCFYTTVIYGNFVL